MPTPTSSAADRKAVYIGLLAPHQAMLRVSRARGRHAVAREDMSPGALVLRESPPAHVVFQQHASTFCCVCLTRFPPRRSTPPDSTDDKSSCVADDNGIDGGNDSNGDAPSRGLFAHGADTSVDCLACTRCRRQTYWCSETCRASDVAHDIICDAVIELPGISGMHSVDPNLVRLILQVIAQTELEERRRHADVQAPRESACVAGSGTAIDAESVPAARTPASCIHDLLSHQKSYPDNWITAVTHAAKDIAECMSKSLTHTDVTPNEIVKLACRINSNSHGLYDPVGTVSGEIGVGMFPLVAMLNHSCAPNCAFVTVSGGDMLVRTLTDVKAGDELCVSYVDVLSPTWERRGRLLSTKFFWCECNRCAASVAQESPSRAHEHELEGVLCPRCRCCALVPQSAGDAETSFCCSETHAEPCGATMTAAQHAAAQQTGSADMDAATALHSIGQLHSVRAALESALSKCCEVLHPHHHVVATLLAQLANVCSRTGRLADALAYADAATTHMWTVTAALGIPDATPEMSDLLERQAQILEIVLRGLEAELVSPTELQSTPTALHALTSWLASRSPSPSNTELPSAPLPHDPVAVHLAHRIHQTLSQCVSIRTICFGPTHARTLSAIHDLDAWRIHRISDTS